MEYERRLWLSSVGEVDVGVDVTVSVFSRVASVAAYLATRSVALFDDTTRGSDLRN